jgi:Fe-S cluster assembly protein SufD
MSAVASKVSAVERYRAVFDERNDAPGALTEIRRAAFERFASLGFPTTRNEDWKYTNLRRFESRAFASSQAAPMPLDESQWIAGSGVRIVLVNGHAAASLSTTSPQPPGVTIVSLGRWLANNPDEVAALLREDESADAPAFEALNTAFFDDGVVIDIADGVTLDEPICVLHQWTPGVQSAMSHPKLFLRAGRDSRCALIEHYLGPDDVDSFTNASVTLTLATGARVSHYRLQHESTRSFHVAGVRVRLDAHSRYACQDIALGAALGRASITATLAGPGAEASLNGLFAPAGTQHLDTFTLVDHQAPHTVSNEAYRGIAAGRGRGVYRGKVIVRQGAQKIDSKQSSRNLLLSPTAEIDTRPELEIHADDVKCAHGATTGQLDATALFYLRSRGISEADARAMLIRAFAESMLSGIEAVPVREYLERQLQHRFAALEVQS